MDDLIREDIILKREEFLSLFDDAKEPILGLAPMAGTSTPPYRALVSRLGADFTVSELASARGIVYNPDLEKMKRYILPVEEEKHFAIQLFGYEPQDFAQAIKILMQNPRYRQVDWIDINMGCPVKKVVNTGAGSALMRTPDRAVAIAAAAVEAAAEFDKAVTVKMRSGWDKDHINAKDLACRLEKEGVAAICVHARTREQKYCGEADWQVLADLRQAIAIPFCVNGDIKSAADIIKLNELAKPDAYMIGRSAWGNPFIFQQIRIGLEGGEVPAIADSESWLAAMRFHLNGMINLLGEKQACREMRSQFSHYVRDFANASYFRDQLMQVEDKKSVLALLNEAAAQRKFDLGV